MSEEILSEINDLGDGTVAFRVHIPKGPGSAEMVPAVLRLDLVEAKHAIDEIYVRHVKEPLKFVEELRASLGEQAPAPKIHVGLEHLSAFAYWVRCVGGPPLRLGLADELKYQINLRFFEREAEQRASLDRLYSALGLTASASPNGQDEDVGEDEIPSSSSASLPTPRV